MLYSGYTFFAIPFAFAIGALIVRRVDADWIRVTRRFALASWMFLGIGILLGARWSYYELGWGGYWGWDPVENAALMPWLISTAFLHSVMIQEKRGMLKIWNASLVLGASTLAIVGTFLVRSGVLDSIHAFTGGGLGIPFVVLIAAMVAGSVYLVISRRDVLRSEHRLDSLLSREAVFLLNNVVLVGLCFVIFWGTFFPLISKAVTGTSAAVGPPWFDRYTVPLALILVLLSGIGPVIAWRRATLANARRNFALPLAAAGAMAIASYTIVPIGSSIPTVVLFCCAIFVFAVIGQEFWRGLRARRAMSSEAPPVALVSMVRRSRRRYGGYIVHVGIAVLFIGVAASATFQHEQQLSLGVGQSVRVGAYTMKYVKATGSVVDDPSHTGATLTLGAVLRVSRGGRYVTTLHTAADYYPTSPILPGQVVADLISGDAVQQIGLDSSWRRDLWAAVKPLGTTLPATGAEIPEERLVALADSSILPSTSSQGQFYAAYIELAAIAKAYRNNPPPASFTLHLLAACDVDLDRRADRPDRRPDRDLAAAGGASQPPARTLPRACRAGAGPRVERAPCARDDAAPGRAADRRAADLRDVGAERPVPRTPGDARRRSLRTSGGGSRPPRRPSTRRSATTRATTAPASCRRRTSARSTASCGRRRSRSCAHSTSSRRRDAASTH